MTVLATKCTTLVSTQVHNREKGLRTPINRLDEQERMV